MNQNDEFVPFDPREGAIVRKAPSSGEGYWAGAPGVFFDAANGQYYLLYRIRRPRGVAPDRGAELYLVRGVDGVSFDDTIWKATKDQLNTSSIERCALFRTSDERWCLLVSYVDPNDGRWRIDGCLADSPESFDVSSVFPVFTAEMLGLDGVKDPFVVVDGQTYWMIVSIAESIEPSESADLHATRDAYNTGLIRSATGLASSRDGLSWQWHGEILGPSSGGWDGYCCRIGCAWRANQQWVALYDGSRDVSENYEEQVGLAYGNSLDNLTRVSLDGPIMLPPTGTGAIRYFDYVHLSDQSFYYYEMANADGSHDLRVIRQLTKTENRE